MRDPIKELNEFDSYAPVTMLAMDAREFEKYMGGINSAVRLFLGNPHDRASAAGVVRLTCSLLERTVAHHRRESRDATETLVRIYDDTAGLLEQILAIDFQMFRHVYDEALRDSLALKALAACGITPPGHRPEFSSSRFESEEQINARRMEALRYASNNIEEFTHFVYGIAFNKRYVPDRFVTGEDSVALDLFKRVIALKPALTMIE